MQKQSHFQSRTHASHSSEKWLDAHACKQQCSRAAVRVPKQNKKKQQNPPTIYRFLSRWEAATRAASSAYRTCQRGRALAQVVAVGAADSYSCYVTQAAPPAQALSLLGRLGVAWSPRPGPCAQRDGCSAQGLASVFADWTVIGQCGSSWEGTRPITGRCVSRRGFVFYRG